jgi:hypothetical protein
MAKKHGHNSSPGKSPTYTSWEHMIGRCTNSRNSCWEHYGGRGITVCERWRKFENFLADMGERPKGTTLERCNTDGNYEPQNCRWATRAEQQNNRRDNVVIEYNDVRRTVKEWADVLGINKTTLDFRIRRGWTAKRAIEKAIDSNHTAPRGA